MMPQLQRGSKGDTVAQLQKFLNACGWKLAEDGDLGPLTEAAVRQYQALRKLSVDGVVGPQTWGDVKSVTPAIAAGIAAARAASVVTPAHPIVPTPTDTNGKPAAFGADGWYPAAVRVPCPYRDGGALPVAPCTVVVHTTDCTPGTMPVILQTWAETKGNGACAHFYLGRQPASDARAQYPDGGLVQMVPITHNGQHAGGARKLGDGSYDYNYHGWILGPKGEKWHPNLCTAGIEIDCAGRLSTAHGVYTHPDTGRIFPASEVHVDAKGHAWHRVTEYQLAILGELIAAIMSAPNFRALPPEWKIGPNGTYAGNGVDAPWEAQVKGTKIVGHWTLDPNNKTDPGPQVMAFLRERFDI